MSWFLYDRDCNHKAVQFHFRIRLKFQMASSYLYPTLFMKFLFVYGKRLIKKLKDPAFLSIGQVFREILSFQK